MKFIKTLNEIKREGWDALVEKLGIAGATMFVMEHEKGYGDSYGYCFCFFLRSLALTIARACSGVKIRLDFLPPRLPKS